MTKTFIFRHKLPSQYSLVSNFSSFIYFHFSATKYSLYVLLILKNIQIFIKQQQSDTIVPSFFLCRSIKDINNITFIFPSFKLNLLMTISSGSMHLLIGLWDKSIYSRPRTGTVFCLMSSDGQVSKSEEMMKTESALSIEW